MYTLVRHPVTVFLTSLFVLASRIEPIGEERVFLGRGVAIADHAHVWSVNLADQFAQVGVQQPLEGVGASSAALLNTTSESAQVVNVDSKKTKCFHWQILHARSLHQLKHSDVHTVIIIRDTDTPAETDFFLL